MARSKVFFIKNFLDKCVNTRMHSTHKPSRVTHFALSSRFRQGAVLTSLSYFLWCSETYQLTFASVSGVNKMIDPAIQTGIEQKKSMRFKNFITL